MFGSVGYARHLRRNQTPAERSLWKKLRAAKFHGWKFRRQVPIGGRYIVDFACMEKRLVVEVDGWIHFFQRHKDQVREDALRMLGFTVLRFSNVEVRTNMEYVLETILKYLDTPSP